jgi:hypothetical protein
MDIIPVFIESASHKTFCGALDYPGWCRSGRDEDAALQTLLAYAPRYAAVLQADDLLFPEVNDPSQLVVAERVPGNATTDFGAPDAVLASDQQAIREEEAERFQAILGACWHKLEQIARAAEGRELRKGPRGGGRDLTHILGHVVESNRAYLASLAYKVQHAGQQDPLAELHAIQQADQDAIDNAMRNGLPHSGPRGGRIWTLRFFVRRVAWHVLDHAWEIEDRTLF